MITPDPLDALLRSLAPAFGDDTVYVFATIPAGDPIPPGLTPRMTLREAEGTTLILPREQAESAHLRHEFPCRMITLGVHSALDAVGFLAHITGALAARTIPVNPVSGFFHDHLFIPVHRADDALAILGGLARDAGADHR